MDFEFNDEQEQLRESVRRFLADRAPITHVREMCDDERGTTDEVWRGLADLGVLDVRDMVDAAVVLEEMGRAVHPGPYASSVIGAAGLLVELGGDDALDGLGDGSLIGTVALNEGVAAGADDRLDGEKVHVPDVCAADLILVTAVAPDGTLGVYAVERDAPGVSVTATPTVDGSRKQGTLTLSSAPARRIGAGDATDAVAATVDRLNTAAVVDGVGAASRALEISVEYARERRQFDVPIGSFQAVQHLCADMLRAVELARAAGYYACWATDSTDAAERHRAATMALAFAADELYAVGASAVQVHAGVGFTWEHDIHLFYKRLLTLQQTGGGTIDQLEELASIVLSSADSE